MREEEYDALPGLRSSEVKAGATSMMHMHAAVTGPAKPDTDTFRWGRLVHAMLAEPDAIDAMPVWDGKTRRGAAWDAFSAMHADYINGEDERAELVAMRAAVLSNPDVRPFLNRKWQTERVVTWCDEYGQGKARLDMASDDGIPTILEVKTTRSIEARAFGRQFSELAYHIQLGWYWRAGRKLWNVGPGCDDPAVYVLTIESAPPYDSALIPVPHQVILEGYYAARMIALRYRECERSGVFPGRYWQERAELVLPPWHGNDGAAWTVTSEEGAEVI